MAVESWQFKEMQKRREPIILSLPYLTVLQLVQDGHIKFEFEYLATRARWCLLNEWGRRPTVLEVAKTGKRKLLRIPNFGPKTLKEIKLWVSSHNLELAD
jgi:DNA-directed RNA polymerase alpha subunit